MEDTLWSYVTNLEVAVHQTVAETIIARVVRPIICSTKLTEPAAKLPLSIQLTQKDALYLGRIQKTWPPITGS